MSNQKNKYDDQIWFTEIVDNLDHYVCKICGYQFYSELNQYTHGFTYFLIKQKVRQYKVQHWEEHHYENSGKFSDESSLTIVQ